VLHGISFDIHRNEATMERIERVFSKEFLHSCLHSEPQEPRPIFIVGMPRSGTTLVEQILDQHAKVHGGGERLFIEQILRRLEQETGLRNPEFVPHLSERMRKDAGAFYLRQLGALAPKTRHVTDKLPGNFAHVGWIKSILPQAKIIWCRRDPRDTAISIYKHFFGGNLPYAYDLYEIGRMSAACERLRAHWRTVVPEADMLEVEYERLVADAEGETRRILAFLGLEWQEECRFFHLNRRPVTTASYEQVRRPVYTHSIGAWNRYAAYLAPFEAGMGGNPGG
jgi:hypothetical protein